MFFGFQCSTLLAPTNFDPNLPLPTSRTIVGVLSTLIGFGCSFTLNHLAHPYFGIAVWNTLVEENKDPQRPLSFSQLDAWIEDSSFVGTFRLLWYRFSWTNIYCSFIYLVYFLAGIPVGFSYARCIGLTVRFVVNDISSLPDFVGADPIDFLEFGFGQETDASIHVLKVVSYPTWKLEAPQSFFDSHLCFSSIRHQSFLFGVVLILGIVAAFCRPLLAEDLQLRSLSRGSSDQVLPRERDLEGQSDVLSVLSAYLASPATMGTKIRTESSR